jgi:hypothetical protein
VATNVDAGASVRARTTPMPRPSAELSVARNESADPANPRGGAFP